MREMGAGVKGPVEALGHSGLCWLVWGQHTGGGGGINYSEVWRNTAVKFIQERADDR